MTNAIDANTQVCAHKQYQANIDITMIAMRDIKSRELRETDPNTNTMICFEVEPPLYVPAFTQKDFHYIHQGPSTKGPSPRNYNVYKSEYITSTLSHLYTRG